MQCNKTLIWCFYTKILKKNNTNLKNLKVNSHNKSYEDAYIAETEWLMKEYHNIKGRDIKEPIKAKSCYFTNLTKILIKN